MSWTDNLPLVNKARKPKFELHLRIYDLNNVPLVSGTSSIKWYFPYSIHREHRGQTHKSPIAHHRVEYNYGKVIPVRIGIDKANNLTECPVEFEVLQEFTNSGGREERITLGKVTLNLAEYVEESEAMLRDTERPSFSSEREKTVNHARHRSSLSGKNAAPAAAVAEDVSPTSLVGSVISTGGGGKPASITEQQPDTAAPSIHQEVEEGIIRRYLMQESKINSTLKVGILMVQTDGERNFAAPPLKTAPVFGGIAGMMMTGGEGGSGQMDPSASAHAPENDVVAAAPTLSKSRDASELQDMYRRTLAASWTCQLGELPADECIEDIFAGGDGFKNGVGLINAPHKLGLRNGLREDSGGTSADEYDVGATLRPVDARRFRRHARRGSGESDRSTHTVASVGGGRHGGHRREGSKDHHHVRTRSRSDSLASLATTIESERGRSGFKSAKEVKEFAVREDLVAWKLPESFA